MAQSQVFVTILTNASILRVPGSAVNVEGSVSRRATSESLCKSLRLIRKNCALSRLVFLFWRTAAGSNSNWTNGLANSKEKSEGLYLYV